MNMNNNEHRVLKFTPSEHIISVKKYEWTGTLCILYFVMTTFVRKTSFYMNE